MLCHALLGLALWAYCSARCLARCDAAPAAWSMPIDAARKFNRLCPPGTAVTVAMRDGSTRTGKLSAPAFLWSGFALVEINGLPSYWTVEAVRPKLLALAESQKRPESSSP